MTDKTTHDAPKRIWLQVCDDADCEAPFQKHYEVSWSASAVGFEHEPEYVRADLVAGLQDKATRFDLDQAGIERRELESIELIQLRATNRRLNKQVVRLWTSARFKELGTNPPDDCPCGSQCVTISCCLCQCAEGKALKEAEG